ncbi:MAG: DNA repair exonuclease [Ruminococcaceae bacterium]|nr:DNA repair exonuclease [Oscillospiraceae bacterium]
MLKIIHAADLHLDSPFAGLSPEQAALRREELRSLPDRLADLANEEQADLVLLAGDLLDGQRIYRETADMLARALGRIRAKVFIAPGNHDPYNATSPYALPIWPDNVHIFTSPLPEAVHLPELNCTVYGAAFTGEQRDDSPLSQFSAAGDLLNLMVLHGNTQGRDYAPIASAEIAASGLDYLALGHIHQHSGLQKSGSTFWAYPGCPEGRGFDELGDKGVLILNAEKGSVQMRFHPLSLRRYQIIDVELTGCSDPLAAITAALPGQTRSDLYRIRLIGEFPMDAQTMTALETALTPLFYALDLRDHTRTPRDLWARSEEDSLTGLFLRTMAARCWEAPEDEVLDLAVRFGLAALENGEDVSP